MNIGLNLILLLSGAVFPLAVVGAYMAAVFCRLVIGTKYIRPYVSNFPKRIELREAYHTMRQLILSSYFSNLAMYFSGAFLTIALGIISTSKELGYFVVAKTLTDAALMMPTALAAFTLPQLAKENTKEGHVRAMGQILIFAIAMLLAVALPMLIFPHILIHLLFGVVFLPAAECLPFLAIGMIAAGMIIVTNQIIASRHQERLLVRNSGMLALCIALLTALFRDNLTALTASYIYAASHMLALIVSLYNALRQDKLPVAK